MKLNIVYEFHPPPWGGANQFLLAFANELRRRDAYESNPARADGILFNANPGSCRKNVRLLYRLRAENPGAVFVIRMAGPIGMARGTDAFYDRLFVDLGNDLADGVLYQSNWSKRQNELVAGVIACPFDIINNAANPQNFYPAQESPSKQPTMALIASSWSPNPRKGFDVYKYLDENLDFGRYTMTFVGRSPISFRQIRTMDPVGSAELGGTLRQHHIFVAPSRGEACSNALVEALSCGLPAVVRAEESHGELIGSAGETFSTPAEAVIALERVVAHYEGYRTAIPTRSIESVTGEYLRFFASLKRRSNKRTKAELDRQGARFAVRLGARQFSERLGLLSKRLGLR